jgi:hypothetical protein
MSSSEEEVSVGLEEIVGEAVVPDMDAEQIWT